MHYAGRSKPDRQHINNMILTVAARAVGGQAQRFETTPANKE